MAQGRFVNTVLGKAGSGKTHLIRECLVAFPRPVLILDSFNDFEDGVLFRSARELARYIAAGRPNISGIYTLKTQSDEDSDAFLKFLTVTRAPLTCVIDEADLFCSPSHIHPDLYATLKYGRHWGQNLVFAARRAAELNRNITAQSDCIISFRQDEPRDVATLKQSYEAAALLPELNADRHEFRILGGYAHLPHKHVLERMPLVT